MSNLEHYFENLLYSGADVNGDVNKNALTADEQNAVEVCAQYVIYTLLPSADVETVRHGRWQVNDLFGYKDMTCTSCGWLYEYYGGLEEEWNYCPHCGARMDGEQNG